MAHDDTIILNGTTYQVRGLANARAISEFQAGFKIGRATYDDREHAFYLPFDDFSGGIGFHRIDIHEALGGIWDNEGGVDIRRSRHVTLPPLRTTLSAGFTAPTAVGFGSDFRSPLVSNISGTDLLYAAIGNKVYTVNSTRTTAAVVATLQAAGPVRVSLACPSMFEWRDPDTNTKRLYVTTINAALDSRYWYSSNGTAWTEGARVVWDAMTWDGKIVASVPLPAGNPWGTQGQIVAAYTSDGVNWNVDDADANVNRPKWFFQGLPHFIGEAIAPWGNVTAPYFLDEGKLWVLDFFKERAIPIQEVGDKQRLATGAIIEGAVWVSDGWNVWVYDPGAGETVRRIGIFNRFGVPPTMQGYTVAQIVGGTSTTYLIVDDNVNAKMRVLAYTGIGWTPITPEISSTNPIGAVVGRFPVSQDVSVPSRFIDVFCNASELSATIKLLSFRLPTTGDIPTPADASFEDGPLKFVSGWIDGGFLDLKGALHRLECDAFGLTTTETIAVEYRLDNTEGAWTSLGTFNSTVRTLWFDATNHRGIEFRTVQFRIALDRGSTATLTPELVALVLVYDKKPEFRSAWTFKIDLNRHTERSPSGAVSVSTLWSALKTLYDTKTLVPLIIPNVEPSPGINVRIVDMPLTLDDWRDAVDGKGFVEITALQPIAG